jgi:hypothetical protein
MNTNFNYKQLSFIFAAFIIICIGNIIIVAQNKAEGRDFCQNNNWSWNGKQSVNETREMVMPSVNLLSVDGKNNGGISVIGENRSDILVRACVQAWAKTDETARQLMQGIRIEKGSNVYGESSSDDKNWSVSYEILVPFKTNLKLKAHNGGISISSVDGDIEFDTQNGGVSLKDLAGNVKGRTQNGGVSVKLSGNSWKGNGLDVETRNGGVSIKMDENYAANIETGTVNGGLTSEIDALKIEKKNDEEYGWSRQNKRINKAINGGGANVRVVTTNGGITIRKN